MIIREQNAVEVAPDHPHWVTNASILWEKRRFLVRVVAVSLVVGLGIAFVIPKKYKAVASIMPPDSSGSSAAVLAALAGHALGGFGGLGGLAGSLFGGRTSSALFVDLLHSGTVSGHLIDRFNLQHAYHKRYRVDTAKYLAHHTTVVDDKKSGVITITVEDSDPHRARDLAQGYLDELNLLVTRTNTSSAHQERVFIERRLQSVQGELERAQLDLSQFSSTHATIDIKEQTRAMVDAAARLQAQLIVGQSEVDSLRQIYGDGNVRVRAAEARVAALQGQLVKMSGSSAPLPAADHGDNAGANSAEISAGTSTTNELYPPLRQLPRLAVPYADLYRRVRVQETVFELLTQQYEMARLQEARDVPIVSIIDVPGVPEKKSFPPRLVVALLLTCLSTLAAAASSIAKHRWNNMSNTDPRKVLANDVLIAFGARLRAVRSVARRGQERSSPENAGRV